VVDIHWRSDREPDQLRLVVWIIIEISEQDICYGSRDAPHLSAACNTAAVPRIGAQRVPQAGRTNYLRLVYGSGGRGLLAR
jgi:hypothetical protein